MPLVIVPKPGNSLGETRDLISGNFTSIGTSFVVDHIDYGITNTGKHNQVTFPTHTGAIAFQAGEIGLFNQTAVPTNIPDLWLKRGTDGAFPMTGANPSQNGWTYLPSGILMKWGRATVNAGNAFKVTFPAGAGIPVFSTNLNVQISLILSGAGLFAVVVDIQPLFFTVRSTPVAQFEFYYTAIGTPVIPVV